jgi:hypothetical protein
MMRNRVVTRRAVVKAGGGLAVMAVPLSGFAGGSGRLAAAQEATPMASPSAGGGLEGRYAAVRIRTLTGGHETEDVLATIEEGFLPLLTAVPGFVAYLGVADPASDQTAFVNVFADKAGADESTRVGGAWLEENAYDFFAGDPVVVEGTVGIAAGSLGGEELAGGYAVIRSRTLKSDRSGAELLDLIREGFVPLLEAVPGFVAYLAVASEETRDQFSIGVFETEEGASESTRLAAEWGAEGAADFVEGDPVVVAGPIAVAATGADAESG